MSDMRANADRVWDSVPCNIHLRTYAHDGITDSGLRAVGPAQLWVMGAAQLRYYNLKQSE